MDTETVDRDRSYGAKTARARFAMDIPDESIVASRDGVDESEYTSGSDTGQHAVAFLEAVRRNDIQEVTTRLEDATMASSLITATDSKRWCALHFAACHGLYEMVEVLLRYADIDVNAKTSAGDTPLHWAAYSGREETTWLLIAHGSDLNAMGNCANTALHLAAAGNHDKVLNLLLQYGANIMLKNSFGNTPVMLTTSPTIAATLKAAVGEKACFKCARAFSSTLWRYQCRFCQHMFCERCSTKELLLEREHRWSVRTCAPCHLNVRKEVLKERENRSVKEQLERIQKSEEEERRRLQEEKARVELEEWERQQKEKAEEERRIKDEEERKKREEQERLKAEEEERLRLEAEAAKKKKKKKKGKKGTGLKGSPTVSPPRQRPASAMPPASKKEQIVNSKGRRPSTAA